jgi:hypothetical protein
MLRLRRRIGSRSKVGRSYQSTSPAWIAAAAVAASGITSHSTRSKCITLPPAMLSAGSWRGT